MTCFKVTGDLWERYLKLIDDDEITDGLVLRIPLRIINLLLTIQTATPWIDSGSSGIAVAE